MISGFGFSQAIARPSVAQQGAAAERAVAQNGAGNLSARDTVARTNQRRVALRSVSAKVNTNSMMLQAAKVGSKKKA